MAMTKEEKQVAMNERNDRISAYYKDGHTLAQCASHFKIGRQRVLQILQKNGSWTPYVKGNRNKFLGVTISDETKAALQERAEREGTSVSRFVSDHLDEMVAKEEEIIDGQH